MGPLYFEISLNDTRAWNKTLWGLDYGIFHTSAFLRVRYNHGDAQVVLWVAEANGIKVVCPLIKREWQGTLDAATPYGFNGFVGNGFVGADIGDWQWMQRWQEYVTEKKFVCAYLGLHPVLLPSAAIAELGVFSSEQTNTVYVMDTTQPDHVLENSLHPHHRRKLRTWRASGARLLVNDQAVLRRAFVGLYPDFIQTLETNAVYHYGNEALEELVNLDQTFLVGALVNDQVEAVSLFGITHCMGDFMYTARTSTGQSHSIAILLQAATILREGGVRWFNLGGGVRSGDNLALFKERMGGVARPLKGIKAVYQPDIYAKLCAAHPVSGESNYFPPYRDRAY